MKIRPFEYARGLAEQYALTSALVASSLTLGLPAAAQPEGSGPSSSDASTTEDASGAARSEAEAAPKTEAAPAYETPSAAEESDAAPDEETARTETKKSKKAETKKPKKANASASASASLDASTLGVGSSAEANGDSDNASEASTRPPPLALELLPPTAYPKVPDPGIPGGSLSWVMNRLQWPYMPKYAGPPAVRVGVSGSAWVDSNYRKVKVGLENESDKTEYRQQGRLTLRVTPVYNLEDNWFLQSNMEFVAIAEQYHQATNYVDVDDAWIRLGKWKLFDIQVGRMQGFEVYHFGMGLDQNTFERQGASSTSMTAEQPYVLDAMWDRGVNSGAVALHWYLPEWVRFEFLTRFGVSGQGGEIGMRPVGVLDLGWMKLKGGYERRLQPSTDDDSDNRTETQGFGASLQFVLDPWVEFGGGVARRVEDRFEVDGAPVAAACHTTITYGGFLNVRPYFEDWMIGVGYHHTDWENFNFDAFGNPENRTHKQAFAAIQYLLWDKLYIKYVLASANYHFEDRNDTDQGDTGLSNKVVSHRLRLMMTY